MSRFDGPAFEALVLVAAKAMFAVAWPLEDWDTYELAAESTEDIQADWLRLARAALVAALSVTETPVCDAACVARWPECEPGEYDPRCCRFPKSCSCGPGAPSWLWLRWAEEAGVARRTTLGQPGESLYRIVPPTPTSD